MIAGCRLYCAAKPGVLLRLVAAAAAAAAAGFPAGPLGWPAESVVHLCFRCVAKPGVLLRLAIVVAVMVVGRSGWLVARWGRRAADQSGLRPCRAASLVVLGCAGGWVALQASLTEAAAWGGAPVGVCGPGCCRRGGGRPSALLHYPFSPLPPFRSSGPCVPRLVGKGGVLGGGEGV